jgi:hypothetical protein
MAVLEYIPVIPASLGTSTNTIYTATLGAGGNSGKVTTGVDMIIRVACAAACNIRFGASATITAATATDMYLPAGVHKFDMGHQNDAIWLFSTPGSIVTVSTIQKA